MADSDWSWTGYARSLLAKAVLHAAALVLPVVIYGTYVGLVVSGLPPDAGERRPHGSRSLRNQSDEAGRNRDRAYRYCAPRARRGDRHPKPSSSVRPIRLGFLGVPNRVGGSHCLRREILVGLATGSAYIPALIYVTFGGALWFLIWFLSGTRIRSIAFIATALVPRSCSTRRSSGRTMMGALSKWLTQSNQPSSSERT